MKYLTVKEIMEITGAKLIQGDIELECKNFSKDTRTIQKGDTYIAIKGENFDGNKFWKEALKKGADCIIVSEIEYNKEELKEFKGKTILKVEDTLQALYRLAKYRRNQYKIPVIAITGSVGKTSTKDIVASVVSQKYKTLKTIGNNNNHIGLSFTILRMKDEEAMVLEMGMNQLREIALLSEIAKPNICVITNIGTSHIGNLGSRENILKAKLEILEGAENPTIIVNNDNDLLHEWQQQNISNQKILTYGINEKSDINAENIMVSQEGSEFICNFENSKIDVKVPVGGEHFVLNSLCAICVGKTLGIEKEKILKGIEEFELTKKRMEIIQLPNGAKIINDAYNASLESIKASLKYLSNYKDNRKIVVLGDILELGEFSEKLHKMVGEEVYNAGVDILICRGANSKYIVDEFKKLSELNVSEELWLLEPQEYINQLDEQEQSNKLEQQKQKDQLDEQEQSNKLDKIEQQKQKDQLEKQEQSNKLEQQKESNHLAQTVFYLKDNEEIVKKLREIVKEKDVILLKASNGMKFYEIAEKMKGG